MSDENYNDGYNLYETGTMEQKDWFRKQWKIWPVRANERFTTNLSFHFGGIQAYRKEKCKEPELSEDLKSNIKWLDKNAAK